MRGRLCHDSTMPNERLVGSLKLLESWETKFSALEMEEQRLLNIPHGPKNGFLQFATFPIVFPAESHMHT